MEPRETFRTAQAQLADSLSVPVRSHELRVDASPVSTVGVVETGPPDGEPVLCLPGATQPAAVFLPLAAALDGYRTVAVDRPGEGSTDMIDYSRVDYRELNRTLYPAVLDALGVDDAHVLAHSQGGFQAFHLAFDRPERLRRLALLGAPGGLTSAGPVLFRLLAVPYLNRLLIRASRHDDPEGVRSDWEGSVVADASEVPTELLAVQVANEALPGRVETQATLAESLWSPLSGTRDRFVFPDRVRALDCPTLFAWGTEDSYRPPSVGEPVAADMANARFERLPGHGHTVWLEAGNDVAGLLREFLPDP
ncbi:alpha/beta fold hydrolase [Halobaculum sp. MBLA0143]|uniref:alpha/beta fold hydrolase n=1 Tax=Halobaculum sp. MBLA0143 TaxID=3079933 RepID=UPI003525ADE6